MLFAVRIIPVGIQCMTRPNPPNRDELNREQQQRLLYQEVSDRLAIQTVNYLEEVQREFGLTVDSLLSESSLPEMINGFDQSIRQKWNEAEVGFVVSLAGH